MAASYGKKVYGLIIPKKGEEKKKALKPNIFGDESDDEDIPLPGKKKPVFSNTNNAKLKTQTQLEIEKAMQDDPTVYEYDEIYDDMQEKKVAKSAPLLGSKDKKPRYIANLIKAAETRKKEDERRKERLVQKERDEEEERGEFQDKEKFVTSNYKKKMLEMEKEAEEEERKARLEAAMDVTKQKDMSGFYRHLLNQQTGEEAIPDNTKVKEPKEEVEEKPSDRLSATQFPDDRDDERSSSSADSDSSRESSPVRSKSEKESSQSKASRNYRRRDDSEDEAPRRKSRSPDSHRKRRRSRSPHESRSKKSTSRSQRSTSRSRRSTSRSRRSTSRDRSSRRSRSRDRDSRSSRSHRDDRDRDRDRDRRSRDKHRDRSRDRGSDRDRKRKADEDKTDRDKRRDKDEKDRKERKTEKSKQSPSVEKTLAKPEVEEAGPALPAEAGAKQEQSLAERFAKRTVGALASDARARYLARKRTQKVLVEKEDD